MKMETSGAGVAMALVIMLSFLPGNHSHADLIELTCQKTHNYSICVSAVRSDRRGGRTNDVRGLALIMLDSLKANGGEILAEVNGLLPKATNEVSRKCLGACRGNLGNALNVQIPQAAAKLRSGSKNEAMIAAIEAGELVIDCDSCFTDERFGPSVGSPPFNDKEHVYIDLITVTKDIIGQT